jgi:cytochrome c oxidase cbb3-type subunit 1
MGFLQYFDSINASVILGTLCLMAVINNAGGEYREYIWPVMLLFGIGLVITLINFLQTIAKRTTKEIYISNWYIVSAIMFGLIIALVAYLPFWQDALGETIINWLIRLVLPVRPEKIINPPHGIVVPIV